MELPTLATSYAGEPLTLYLSASDIAIGAVLLTDRKNVLTPIYYVSRTLTASSNEGSGVGLRLVNPEGHEFTYAIKLDFKSTNNEAEYEDFLVGLRIAKKLGVKHLEARVDSMLITEQINGTYEAKNDVMASYLSQAKDFIIQFLSYKVIHIKRSENKSADALSKLASTNFEHFAKDIRVEVLDRPSVPQHQVLVIQTGVESWMTPIMAYLTSRVLSEEKAAARKSDTKP
ncbi:uncharacterized protein LOC143595533 [Bidens hawaiensis]|uniref:uncharacterized protein LOC143595533 n=1 Tax=Bidens hawaiensis TaxID=980011 RepID=UPI00404A8592